MADCFALEVDDLHRRWLPREIFADIGIVDPAPAPAPAPAPPSAAAVEDVAVHLTGILGGKQGPPPPPPGLASHQPRYRHQPAPQVCGQQGAVLVAYGAVVPAPWPFLPYPAPLQWQATTTNLAHGGGFPGPSPAPPRPVHGPPPAKRRLGGTGGTGVFLPRTNVYQYQHKPAANKSPAKDWKPQQQQQQQRGAGEGTAATQQQQQNASAAVLALPQEWTY
ncbi:uncharacterized protein [Lolium perenne]|uniref:uncharacterized protein n=1 Tax=Lolium perenne TaxID=4522 RepID=UPI0021F5E07D|nr:uncharacterized protein LOC127304782 [Lolium perenne]